MMKPRRWSLAIGVVVVAGLLAACGNSGGDKGSGSDSAVASTTTTSLVPKRGGSLTFGVFSQTVSLDPAVSTGGGTTGADELAALYDTLMRYNDDTGMYEPQTAQSLTSNSDFTIWTLKLKPNIKFTDGTPYNAQAVVYNFKRLVTKRQAASGFITRITNYNVIDDLTLEFTLNAPWSGFPFVLAYNTGSIASPTAIEKLGDQQLGLAPVGAGAGPFVYDSFKPNEGIVLKRNPNYWGGDVYLDELRFVRFTGATATYDALKANSIQAGFLREPLVVKRAQQDGTPGYLNLVWGGEVLLLNNGVTVTCAAQQPAQLCAGKPDGTRVPTQTPTADKRLRQAIGAAIDTATVDQRVNQGTGYPGSELFQKSSKWFTGVAGPKYDVQRARDLVNQVKADGSWDGSIRLECDNSPPRQAEALAVSTMLQAAGFKVNVNTSSDIAAVSADVIVKKDFDIACFGINIFEQDPFVNLSQRFLSNSPSNFQGSVSATIDAAIKTGGIATTVDQRKAVFDQFAKAITEDVPLLIVAAATEYIAWNKNVHGIRPNVTTSVQFDKAWIG
jgi:peptide/nickel transport system substrate-binding protein